MAIEAAYYDLAVGEDQIAFEAHQTIFKAVVERNPDRAEKAIKDHLDDVARRYGEIVEGTG